jgi:hypothetical protein
MPRWHAFRALIGGLLCVAAIAGCGGGDDGPAPTPVTPPADQPPGAAVSATIGTAGGELAFTASGIGGTLRFPASTLAADTVVTVTPLAPGAGEWARVRIDGPVGMLDEPATLTLRLAEAAGRTAAGVRIDGTEQLPLPTRASADRRELAISVQAFADPGPATAPVRAQSKRVTALAAGAPPPVIGAQRSLSAQLTLDALRRSIEAHEREVSVHTGLDANLAAAAVRQMINGNDPAEARLALQEIAAATDKACTQLRVTLLAAQTATVPADLNARDDSESRQWIFQVLAPALYWQAVVMKLGGDPCANADVYGVLNAKLAELLAWVQAKTTARHDADGTGRIVAPVPQMASLARHARILEAPPLETRLVSGFVEPAMLPLRAITWAADAPTQAHYLYVLSLVQDRYVGLYVGPFRDDAQMVRTRVQAQSRGTAGGTTEVLDQTTGGGGATPNQTLRDLTLAARAGAQVTVAGPIDVLNCPAAAQERLVVEFEGVVVLERPSAGARLLDGSVVFEVDALLAAANIRAVDARRHRLQVKRVGSTCNTAFGSTDTVLVTITLDFGLADSITREIQAVKELMYLNPSDAALSRLSSLRSLLLARGETQRAESVLADPWIKGQLYCVHQRAHDECASGAARAKAEATLQLLAGVAAGSSGLTTLNERARDSLQLCPFPAFVNGGVYGANAATVTDFQKVLTWSIFLNMARSDTTAPTAFYFDVVDESVSNKRVYGTVPVSGGGPTFTGVISDGEVLGLYGSRLMMYFYQRAATNATSSITVNGGQVSGWFDLYQYQEVFEGPWLTARVSFAVNVTLPAVPSPTRCDHASLPRPEGA